MFGINSFFYPNHKVTVDEEQDSDILIYSGINLKRKGRRENLDTWMSGSLNFGTTQIRQSELELLIFLQFITRLLSQDAVVSALPPQTTWFNIIDAVQVNRMLEKSEVSRTLQLQSPCNHMLACCVGVRVTLHAS